MESGHSCNNSSYLSNPVSVKNLTAIETSTIVKLLRSCVPVGRKRTSKYTSTPQIRFHGLVLS
jgi:hypothetical protein